MNKTLLLIGAAVVLVAIVVGAGLFLNGKIGGKGAPAIPSGYKTYVSTSTGISFGYPESLPWTYITAADWPPTPFLIDSPYSCTSAGAVNAPAGKTEERTVNGHTYCITQETQGAAGSIYSLYAYAMPKGGKVVILTLGLRAVQCVNYEDPKRTECENERAAANVDAMMDPILQSIDLK